MEFQLIYDGEGLINHEISPLDLSNALIGINTLLEEADTIINRGKTKTHVKVKASFETGCFKINFKTVQDLLDMAADKAVELFSSNEATAVCNAGAILGMIYGVIKLLKFLKGGRPERIFENADGSFTVVKDKKEYKCERNVIALYKSHKIRKSFEIITMPLSQNGIEDIAFKEKDKDFVRIQKEEQQYFVCPKPQEQQIDKEPTRFETNISIINLSFKDGNKWYINDGESSFYATVEDNDFLSRINNSMIKFSKGDILRVVIRRVQYYNLDESKLKSEHFIEKVLNHNTPEQTANLFDNA